MNIFSRLVWVKVSAVSMHVLVNQRIIKVITFDEFLLKLNDSLLKKVLKIKNIH